MAETVKVTAHAYELLKASGHSPAKAHEIALDAKRGDKHAIEWIKMIQARTR